MDRTVKITGFFLTLLVMAIIAYCTLGSDVQLAPVFTGSFKLGHFLAYTALGFLLFICYCSLSRRHPLRRNILPAVSATLMASLYGYMGELCQPFFGRHFALYDMFIDTMGALLGSAFGLVCVVFVCKIEKRGIRG
ncbi:MAG: VanZ family protein [bacterium]|nr:VanZ family protein [Spirochaetales bacterium]MDT3389612.1 VanZ family protein [bacterium]